MADVFSTRKRSAIMSRVLSRGNKRTELALMMVFRRHRIIGWRRHLPIFGSPDFVFRDKHLAIFVDGCFWHGCPVHGMTPKQNASFWREKIARNQARDQLVNRTLRRLGWRVLRVWQHELTLKNERRLVVKLRRAAVLDLKR